VIDARCGIVLDNPEDASALAGAVTALACDSARARAMGEAARERARALSWQQMAARYLALYDALAARPSAQPLRVAADPLSGGS